MKKKLIGAMLGIGLASAALGQTAQKGLLVGYIDYTGAAGKPTLVQSVQQGYNMIVIGFASVSGNQANINLIAPPYSSTLVQQVQSAQQMGAKVLVTLGGQNNTFNPATPVQPGEAKAVADSLYTNVLKKYNLDGVDFDLETVPVGPQFVKDLIVELKKLDPSIIITGAPQASVWWKNGGTLSYAPGIWAGKDGLVQSGLFNDILLQVYNQFGGIQVYANGSAKLGENTPGIVAALYDLYLTNNKIPQGTKLILGFPSSKSAASDGMYDPQQIKAELNCLSTGQQCTAAYQPSKQYAVPGIMTWSIGHDAQDNSPSWNFSSQLKACVVNGQCAN